MVIKMGRRVPSSDERTFFTLRGTFVVCPKMVLVELK